MSKVDPSECNIYLAQYHSSNGFIHQYPIKECLILKRKRATVEKLRYIIDSPYDGYRIETDYKDGMINGNAIVYNAHGVVIGKLQMKNEMRDGVCLEYDQEGNLLFEGFYVDDKRQGLGKEYSRGVVSKYIRYIDDKPSVIFIPSNRSGFFEERDPVTNEIVAISFLDDVYARNGLCYLYKDKVIQSIVQYNHGEAIHCVRSFENGTMTIFDINNCIVYKGQFKDSFDSDYPCDGYGDQFNANGLVYSGMFSNNQRSGRGKYYLNGIKRYDGLWEGDYPNGEGQFFDENGKEFFNGEWILGYGKINDERWLDYETGLIEKVNNKMKLKKWRERNGLYESCLTMFNRKMKEVIIWEDCFSFIGLIMYLGIVLLGIYIYNLKWFSIFAGLYALSFVVFELVVRTDCCGALFSFYHFVTFMCFGITAIVDVKSYHWLMCVVYVFLSFIMYVIPFCSSRYEGDSCCCEYDCLLDIQETINQIYPFFKSGSSSSLTLLYCTRYRLHKTTDTRLITIIILQFLSHFIGSSFIIIPK